MRKQLPYGNLLTSFLVLAALKAAAQDFTPFNAGSHKLFANAAHDEVFSLAFDSTNVSGDTTTYHTYRTRRDEMVPSNCGWWRRRGWRRI